ncbi:MAG: cell division protein FtsZ [Chlorobiota bacterium]
MISIDTHSQDRSAKIKVIGVGGGGGNAINNMIERGLSGVEFIVANTDNQALEYNRADIKVQLGKQKTKGLGAGADPTIGKTSVEESIEDIKKMLEDTDMVFITAGMGGGTGTGGAPEIAKLAKSMDTLTVSIVTTPFAWEGKRRMEVANKWIEELRQNVDALIVIPNQKLLEIIDKNTSLKDAFLKVDEVLYNATRGISDIISQHGVVNVDFADVRTIMKDKGDALMGIGIATGENRAIEATEKAINSPLLDGISIEGSKGVLVNISGGSDLTMFEVSEAVSVVESAAGGNANIIHGVVYNDDMEDGIMVTVVATGFNNEDPNQEENEVSKRLEKKEDNDNSTFGARFKDSSPKGLTDLKKYSIPAVHRTNRVSAANSDKVSNVTTKMNSSIETKRNEPSNPTSEKRVDEKVADKIKKDNYSNYSRPTFIRKMMMES